MSLANTRTWRNSESKIKIKLENLGLCKGVCLYSIDIIKSILIIKFNTGERNLFMYILLQVFSNETTLLTPSESVQSQIVS